MGVPSLVWGGRAGQGREGPPGRTQAQSLLPARARATPPCRARPGHPGPHQVPGAGCFGARILRAPQLQHGPQAPRPRCVPLPVRPPPPHRSWEWGCSPSLPSPTTLPPLQRAVAAGRGRPCGPRAKSPSRRKPTLTGSERWGALPGGPAGVGPVRDGVGGVLRDGAGPAAASSLTVAIARRPLPTQQTCLPSFQLPGPPALLQGSGGALATPAAAGLGCTSLCPAPTSGPTAGLRRREAP